LHPEYAVRESSRAKHVRFTVSISDGLVVVIPKGFDRRRIPGLIEGKLGWIERAMKRVEALRAAWPDASARPESIELPAIGRTWRIDWREAVERKVKVTEAGPLDLRVSGPIGNPDAWRQALRQWLIGQGRKHLIPWAEELARELDIRIGRVSIRCQKTRWGSYTGRKGQAATVSLNAQLLFLPEHLVRYVLIHELCHAVHPDHSHRFWELVESHESGTSRLRQELRAAWRLVPGWLSTAFA